MSKKQALSENFGLDIFVCMQSLCAEPMCRAHVRQDDDTLVCSADRVVDKSMYDIGNLIELGSSFNSLSLTP